MAHKISKHPTHVITAPPSQDMWPSNQPTTASRRLSVKRDRPTLTAHSTSRVTVNVPTILIERLRNAIYWTKRATLARVITDALDDAVAEMEQANGGVYPPRLAPLKPGRPRRRPKPQTHPPCEQTV